MTLWFILFFAPAAFGATEWWSRALLESAIFLLAAFCVLRQDFAPPFGGAFIGFIIILALGVVQVMNSRPMTEPAGLLPFSSARDQALGALLFWVALTALLWSTSGILRWEGAVRRLSLAIFGIGLFIAVVGILQRGQGNTAYYGLRLIHQGGVFGPFTNHDHAATWMVASVFAGAGIFATGFQRGIRAPLADRVAKQTLIAFALAILIAAVFETGSRGGINAFFVSAFVTAYLASGALLGARTRLRVRAGLGLAGIAYALYLYTNPKWLGFEGGGFDMSATYRVSMYRSGLRMLLDFPIFGVGIGNIANVFHLYKEPIVVEMVDHVHSSWLEIALESGLFGVLVFSATVLKPLADLGRRLASPNLPTRSIAAGCFAALLAFIVHGFVECSFQIPADAVLFVVLVAAVSVLFCTTSKLPQVVIRRLRFVQVSGFVCLALLSLPPGFRGMALRLNPPFAKIGDTLLFSPESEGGDLAQERKLLFRNPFEKRARYRYGFALWKKGRQRDAEKYLYTR